MVVAMNDEAAMEVVESVKFGFMTDDEVRKVSLMKRITETELVDILGKPIPGGLYDPIMGPLHEFSLCQTCGLLQYKCPGHYGHIELVSPAYNPLLFTVLSKILSKTCFSCFHFRTLAIEAESCVSRLELIAKGDKKKMDQDLPDASYSSGLSDVEIDQHEHNNNNINRGSWDSAQLTEAMSVLKEFLKKTCKQCKKCKFKNPKITKPTFGWFYLDPIRDVESRANAINILKMEDTPLAEEVDTIDDGEPSIIATDKPKKPRKKQPVDRTRNSNNYCSGPLLPSEVRDILRRLWENEAPLCSYLCDIHQQQFEISGRTGYSMFFLETVLVPPIKFRLPAIGGGNSVMEHPHTVLLGKVLQSNNALGLAFNNNAKSSKIISCYMELQQSINVLYDSKTATSRAQKEAASGICQYLDKKEGIFRQKIMGKRVNFACRSVISPDPYLAINEIGIPPNFALTLTYPERVTPWNAGKLRGAVVNGPEIHPGATAYIDSVSNLKLFPNKNASRLAISRKLPSSRGGFPQSANDFEGKIVNRHLQDGDIVLVNRQPTLHKPGIMAHVVRVLKGEKTLRMHYANCSSYNADFDGDEINVHFPQDEVSRAEAYNIVNANEQYIVPTRGDTVRGLIQDSIVSSVLLTMKDTFLTRSEFSQLLYGSGVFASGLGCKNSQKVSIVDSEGVVECVLPTIWKPEPLWTGKQVITALLHNITRGCAPCTVKNQAKLSKNYFTGNRNEGEGEEDHNAEHNLLVWKNELVRGVIDKAQFGKFGLVHTVQELYGANTAGILLSGLSRLFTNFLQIHGFTCGLDDLIILPDYDVKRKEKLEGKDVGEEVHREFVKSWQGDPEGLQLKIEKAICSDREASTALLDMKMKNKLTDKLTKEGSQILKHLLTAGLLKPFPKNCISVMTTTGAKGSTVNFQQISAYLGQQELEGKRVPRMVSGKTLPSFPPWDYASRAGGFITDRFLTGLRPQEYYFHCMAGREGLVDTAVKTSRSGYLQRCLVKNLESLKVCYDCTVRDSDGSIIQFYYGEDGVDVHKTSFLNNFKALKDNQETIRQKFQNPREFNAYIEKLPEGLEEEARHFIIQEELDKSSEKCVIEHVRKKRKLRKKQKEKTSGNEQENFIELLKQKYLSSLAESGEPVGVIAAQSVGEPSTQMTLNTFHLAGRGEMNVTLGIPRLQEILMTASPVIKTPILTCPLLEIRPKHDVVSIVSNAKKVTVADLVESMEVQLASDHKQIATTYKLKMILKDSKYVSLENVHDTLKSTFLRELEDEIVKYVVFISRISGIKSTSKPPEEASNEQAADDDNNDSSSAKKMDDDDDDDDDDVDKGDDLGSDGQKRKDEVEYDEGSDDVGEDNSEKSKSDDEDEETEQDLSNSEDEDEEPTNVQNEEEDEVMAEAAESELSHKKAKSNMVEILGVEELPKSSDNKKRRAIYLKLEGWSFEVHLSFTDEPHLLLAQIAQKTAKKVYIKRSGKISQCRMVQHDADEKTVIWDDNKKNSTISEEDASYWGIKASGVDFNSFWEMADDLDLSRLYSNNIHAMLNTYGVEAARATLIREVKQVFANYGVKIDFRHLSLIADYMTHNGGYRPMSRHGSISKSVSPFLKMSFEMPSHFLVEAASYGLTDNLETPSSRICLGLPVKMGTGCFDVMQNWQD